MGRAVDGPALARVHYRERSVTMTEPANQTECDHDNVSEPSDAQHVCLDCGLIFLRCPGCSEDPNTPSIYHAPPLCPLPVVPVSIVILHSDDNYNPDTTLMGVFTDLFKARNWVMDNPPEYRDGYPGHYQIWASYQNKGKNDLLCEISAKVRPGGHAQVRPSPRL